MGFQLIKYDDNPVLHPLLSRKGTKHQNAAADQFLSLWTNNRSQLETKKKKEETKKKRELPLTQKNKKLKKGSAR
jgi:hypothetical protein